MQRGGMITPIIINNMEIIQPGPYHKNFVPYDTSIALVLYYLQHKEHPKLRAVIYKCTAILLLSLLRKVTLLSIAAD